MVKRKARTRVHRKPRAVSRGKRRHKAERPALRAEFFREDDFLGEYDAELSVSEICDSILARLNRTESENIRGQAPGRRRAV